MQYIVLTPCFDGANINKFLLTRQGILVYISATFLDISSIPKCIANLERF